MAKETKKTQDNKKEKVSVKKEVNKKKEKVEKKKEVIKEEVVTPKKEKKVKVKPEKKEKIKKFDADKFNEKFAKVDAYRLPIILFIVGFLLATLIFRCIFWPDRIATLKDGSQPVAKLKNKTITADDLYTEMKEYYSVNVLLNTIDDIILSKKYPSDNETEEKIKSTAEYYYSTYEQNYGYTKETFLSQYGFSTEKDFLNNLRLDYRKNKYYDDYVLNLITDNEIQKYYDEEVFGDVDSKHILVSIAKDGEEGLSDEEAKKLAKEIIEKLDKGTKWDDVVKEYKDKTINEDLGYNAFNAELESAYLKECKNLKVGEYSKTPVLTSYGYHIVYKKDQKDKPKLKDVKDDVKDVLAKQKKDADTNLYYKALIHMRDDAGLKFTDTKLGDEYTKYMSQYK